MLKVLYTIKIGGLVLIKLRKRQTHRLGGLCATLLIFASKHYKWKALSILGRIEVKTLFFFGCNSDAEKSRTEEYTNLKYSSSESVGQI
jgi:hypothetical protein